MPPLRLDERQRFNRRHNPFFDHADVQLFLAWEDGDVVGRIGAIDDRLHNETHAENVAAFGFLEATSAGVCASLLDAVDAWARDRGRDAVRGPLNPSLHESAGLLVDGFDDDPVVMMPYNSPEIVGWVQAAGYTKAKDLYAWMYDTSSDAGSRVRRLADRVRRRGAVTVRALRMAQFQDEIRVFVRIYSEAWRDNWGFVPPTPRETEHLADRLKPILDPKLVLFAEVHGEPVACAIALPDFHQLLRGTSGRLSPALAVRFLRRRRIIDRVRIALFGVLDRARHVGAFPLLVDELFRHDERNQYRSTELSWTLEDNVDVNSAIAALGATHYKTYRIYQKKIAG